MPNFLRPDQILLVLKQIVYAPCPNPRTVSLAFGNFPRKPLGKRDSQELESRKPHVRSTDCPTYPLIRPVRGFVGSAERCDLCTVADHLTSSCFSSLTITRWWRNNIQVTIVNQYDRRRCCGTHRIRHRKNDLMEIFVKICRKFCQRCDSKSHRIRHNSRLNFINFD
jgi:hypothetical protein